MIHDVASFLRWRLKPSRWAAKGLNSLVDLPQRVGERSIPPIESALIEPMKRDGYVKLDRTVALPEIDLAPYRGRAVGKPFIDIKSDHMEVVTASLASLLSDPSVSGLVLDYFDGRPWLWNFSLNYSDPMAGVTDSQLWHFDYGDTRQLHFMIYFSDVDAEAGPFTFLPAAVSDKVDRHPLIIERMTDEDLLQRFEIETNRAAVRLCGKRGEVFANDPGRLMHQGARCTRPRLVLFASFTTRTPMSRGGTATISTEQRRAFGRAFREQCPDSAIPRSTFS